MNEVAVNSAEALEAKLVALMQPVVSLIDDHPIDKTLEDQLNAEFEATSDWFDSVEHFCRDAIAAGWMCAEGEGTRRFGRVVEPSDQTNDMSVDVVDLTDVRGGHHKHPNGEVLMIMPQDETAQFDRRGRGWLVYGAGTAHRPTVRNGRALVLYLLPEGKIEWTK